MVQTSVAPSARRVETSYYCPTCLRNVEKAAAVREARREACKSGTLEVSLLHCPVCDLVLAAEVVQPALATAA